MLWAHPGRCPCCELTHTPFSSARPASGTVRASPDLRPGGSRSTTRDARTPILSSAATTGFITTRPICRSNLSLRRALRELVVAMVNDVNRTFAQLQDAETILRVVETAS